MVENPRNELSGFTRLTTAEHVAGHGMAFTRVFDRDVSRVFAAWTQADIFERWWVPKSMGVALTSCSMDVRVGGQYRLTFHGSSMAFYGTYLEVLPGARLVWTNEESGDAGAITTVTFEPVGDRTRVRLQELHPSAEAFAAAGGGDGAAEMMSESFDQLADWLARDGATR